MLRLLPLSLLFLANVAFGQVTDLEYKDREFSWTAPTSCADGSDVSNCPLTGYRIYCDNLASPYAITDTAAVSFTAPAGDFPVGGPYTCYATALSGGLESVPSNSVVFNVVATPVAPGAPGNFTVQSDLTASTIIEAVDQIILLAVGKVPAGTQCDQRMQVNGQYLVPRGAVTWNPGVEPQMAVFANCG